MFYAVLAAIVLAVFLGLFSSLWYWVLIPLLLAPLAPLAPLARGWFRAGPGLG